MIFNAGDKAKFTERIARFGVFQIEWAHR